MEQPIFFFFNSSYIVLKIFNVLGGRSWESRGQGSHWGRRHLWLQLLNCIENQIFKGTGKGIIIVIFYDSKLITEVEFILKVQSMSSH